MSKSTLLSTAGKPIEEAALGKLEAGLLGQVIRLNSERYELERRSGTGPRIRAAPESLSAAERQPTSSAV